MKILILSQWFDPEPAFKGLLFARELRRRGHEVQVITGFPNYPGGKLYPGYEVRLWRREVIDGISVLRVPLYPSHERSAVGRVLNYGTFALSASTIGWGLSARPDLVYVYHPPATIGMPALVARRLLRIPVVYDIQDLWPDAIAATGMLSRPSALRAIDRWCRVVYRNASRIVVLSPGFKSVLTSRGVPESKVDVIYNWCDEASIRPNGHSTQIAAPGEFPVVFAGTMGMAQALDAVLDAARLCTCSVPRARFIFVGSGVDRDRLEQRARDLDLPNVTFMPRQPIEAMGAIFAAAGALLVHLKDDPLFRITIPSKTQAYLAAGKPVLMGALGDAADLVRRSAAGLVCEPENPGSIAAGVRTLAELPTSALQEMGLRGRHFYHRELSLTAGVNRFEQVFRAALN